MGGGKFELTVNAWRFDVDVAAKHRRPEITQVRPLRPDPAGPVKHLQLFLFINP